MLTHAALVSARVRTSKPHLQARDSNHPCPPPPLPAAPADRAGACHLRRQELLQPRKRHPAPRTQPLHEGRPSWQGSRVLAAGFSWTLSGSVSPCHPSTAVCQQSPIPTLPEHVWISRHTTICKSCAFGCLRACMHVWVRKRVHGCLQP